MSLQAHGIRFHYQGRPEVLKGISASFEPGKVTALLGPNGSGKTTLLKILLGILRPVCGKVTLEGEPLPAQPRRRARRLAYVPQVHRTSFPYRVVDVVLLGRTPHLGLFQSPSRRDRQRAYRILDRFGIEHLAHRSYHRLSGGEVKLVLIARSFMQDPALLLLDEPTAPLDLKNQTRILQLVRDAAHQEETMVLLTLHDPNLAAWHADRVLVLARGRLAAEGTPREVLTPEILTQAYGTPVTVDRTRRTDLPVILPEMGFEAREGA